MVNGPPVTVNVYHRSCPKVTVPQEFVINGKSCVASLITADERQGPLMVNGSAVAQEVCALACKPITTKMNKIMFFKP